MFPERHAHPLPSGSRLVATRSRQRGLAAAEFAIGGAVVATMLLLAGEVGRLLYSYAILEQAVRNGSRYASAEGTTAAKVLDLASITPAVQNLVVTGNLAGSGRARLDGLTTSMVTVVRDAASTVGEDLIEVRADYPYQPLFSNIPIVLTGSTADFTFTMTALNVVRALP